MDDASNVAKIKGQTPVEINGMKEGSERFEIVTKEGNRLIVLHESDCCETVEIAQVDGDPLDLLGLPLLMAEMVEGESQRDDGRWGDPHTWTFVKFATAAGYVTLRWLGSSNGYYSETPNAYYNEKPWRE